MFTREVNDVDLVEYDFWIIYLLSIYFTILNKCSEWGCQQGWMTLSGEKILYEGNKKMMGL